VRDNLFMYTGKVLSVRSPAEYTEQDLIMRLNNWLLAISLGWLAFLVIANLVFAFDVLKPPQLAASTSFLGTVRV